MPYYVKNYRLQFTTVPQGTLGVHSTINIDIADTQSGETEEFGYEELRGAGDAFKVETVNNGEDKFSPIRAKKATIQFNSNASFDLNTFTGEDDRYLVHAWVQETSETIFKGFLVLDDNREAYLPKPNVVTLTATDNIGLLKDIALTKPDGTNPRGRYTIVQYLAWALQKTGLELDIMVGNNVKGEHKPTEIMFQSVYLDAKTWEDEVGTSIDCYSVLERIMESAKSVLTQQGGKWYVMRLDEYEWADQHFRIHQFDYEGTFVETHANWVLDMEVGTGKEMKFSQEATEVTLVRPKKFIKETYNFDLPREIIDNIDFDRGAERVVQDIPDFTHTDDNGVSETRSALKYDLDDWTAYRRYSDKSSQGTEAIDYYIRRDYDEDGYEREHYIVITPPASSASPWHHIESNAVPMGANDKFTFSVDFRFTADITGTGGVTFDWGHVRLEGLNGAVYTVDNNGFWHLSPTRRELGTAWAREEQDETDWQHVEVEVKPLPVSGNVYFALYSGQLTSADGGLRDVQYQNLQLEYKPYINGSYLKYKAQYTKVEQDAGLRSSRPGQVYITDSPRPLFKGYMWALHVIDILGIPIPVWGPCGKFWNGGVPSLYDNPTPESLHPLGHLQAYEVWNQHNRVMRVFEATIQGLQLNVACPGIINRYRFTDSSVHNAGKYFVLLQSSQDFYTGEWTGTFAEVFDTTIGKEYDSPKEFKYVSDRG